MIYMYWYVYVCVDYVFEVVDIILVFGINYIKFVVLLK